jgi:two-component system chemotaxis response regulator CheY
MALNILVVDDSSTVRAVIRKTLELAEVPVSTLYEASNGREALDLIAENWVDLIFADINMPVMGGIEMIDKLNEDGILKSVPVVIISTEGSATRIEQLKQKGVSAYLRKPFTPEHLKQVVDDVLRVQGSE